jgi:hypothetical protein
VFILTAILVLTARFIHDMSQLRYGIADKGFDTMLQAIGGSALHLLSSPISLPMNETQDRLHCRNVHSNSLLYFHLAHIPCPSIAIFPLCF